VDFGSALFFKEFVFRERFVFRSETRRGVNLSMMGSKSEHDKSFLGPYT
jgi:hypothetical protein